jgi:hypothetical protein
MTKSRPTRLKGSQAEQSKRFIEAARELGCDEDRERSEEKLRKIATRKSGNEKSQDKSDA